jgi:hypothetical protein
MKRVAMFIKIGSFDKDSLQEGRPALARDLVAFEGSCSVVAPDDLKELIRSEFSRMNEIKFSLLSRQMFHSMILSQMIPRPECTKQVVSLPHAFSRPATSY